MSWDALSERGTNWHSNGNGGLHNLPLEKYAFAAGENPYQTICSGQSKRGSLIAPFSSLTGFIVKTDSMCAARMKSVD